MAAHHVGPARRPRRTGALATAYRHPGALVVASGSVEATRPGNLVDRLAGGGGT
jgi:hypothetical protein